MIFVSERKRSKAVLLTMQKGGVKNPVTKVSMTAKNVLNHKEHRPNCHVCKKLIMHNLEVVQGHQMDLDYNIVLPEDKKKHIFQSLIWGLCNRNVLRQVFYGGVCVELPSILPQ